MPQFTVRGVPYIVILSPEGEILATNRGLIQSEAFVKILDYALAKSTERKTTVSKAVVTPLENTPSSAEALPSSNNSESEPKTLLNIFKKQ